MQSGKPEPELTPCQVATFYHFHLGGPDDGLIIPAPRCYEWTQKDGRPRYFRASEPERMDEPPEGHSVLFCGDDYMESVPFRVEMREAK